MINYKGWQVEELWDADNAWHVLTFFEDGKTIGDMYVSEPDTYTQARHIFGISSFQERKGNGRKMIQFLADVWDTFTITGDADPDSIPFWDSFQPTWDEDNFVIELLVKE